MHDVDIVNVSGTELSLVELDDGALLTMARSGHQEAYAALFSRYSYAALRLARHLGQKEDSDDVVSEAFAQVLDLLGRGKGPERAFRAYLFTTVRHECARRAKARKRVMPTDDLQQIDTPVAFGAGQLDGFERSAIRAAYESLPVRWQTVLWHLDVEGRKPHELGPLLDLSANSVSALVYRARAGLREACLQQHVKQERPTDSKTCLEHRSKLSAFVRRTASAREQERIHAHLESCSDCMAIYLDLQEVNRDVGLIAVPAAVAVGAGLTATSVGAHLLVLAKGLVTMVVPPAAAAALASAAVVGVSSTIPEPQRQSVAVSAAPLSVDREPAADPSPERAVPDVAPQVSRSADRPSVTSAQQRSDTAPAAATVSEGAEPAAAPRPSAAPQPSAAQTPRPIVPRIVPVDASALLPDLTALGLSTKITAVTDAVGGALIGVGSATAPEAGAVPAS